MEEGLHQMLLRIKANLPTSAAVTFKRGKVRHLFILELLTFVLNTIRFCFTNFNILLGPAKFDFVIGGFHK